MELEPGANARPMLSARAAFGLSEDPDSARRAIAQHQQAASQEELCGCFGTAEVHWKAALDLAERFLPGTPLHSSVAVETGLFLHRFLPKSEVPLKYLRIGETRSHLLEAEYAMEARLTLVQCLIESENCREAESLIGTLDRSDPEIEGKASCFLGMIALARKDILKAESLLREAVVKCRPLRAEIYGETLTALGEVLIEKEQYSECESVALEAISVLQGGSLLPALRLFARVCGQTNRFKQLDQTMESVICRLRESPANQYFLAEVITLWGDAYIHCSYSNAALHYLQSLRLCQGVKESSWYVARILQRLVRLRQDDWHLCQFAWTACVSRTAGSKLQDLLPNLPTVSSMLSVCEPALTAFNRGTSEHIHWTLLKKLEWLVANGDEVESGEAALIITPAWCTLLFGANETRSIYLHRFPCSKSSARLLAHDSQEDMSALRIYQRVDVTHAELIRVIKYDNADTLQRYICAVEDSEAIAPVSLPAFESLLAQQYSRSENVTAEVETLMWAMKVAEELNPLSSLSLMVKLVLGARLRD